MKKISYLIIIFIIVIIAYFSFLKKDEVINIGFVGGLSGKYSSLGHSILNGLKLALEEEKELNGKKINLIIKDDRQDKNGAKEAIEYFEKNKINLVVGNITSSMTKISLNEIKNKNIFLISPSSSSSEFSYKDDNFFRVQVAQSKSRFDMLSKYLVSQNIKNIYTLYDPKNRSYTSNYLKNFELSFVSHGGNKFLKTKSINEKYPEILEDIKSFDNIDSILIVANSLDTSKLIQYLKLNNIKNKSFIASGWAKNFDFIEEGGKAVEGTIFLTSYDENSTNKKYLNFVSSYTKKYNMQPSVFSAQGYETGKIIIKILKENENLSQFKNILLSNSKFEGLQGFILFDKYGDVKRQQYLTEVKDGEYKKIDIGTNGN